jgi:hypothetical protein
MICPAFFELMLCAIMLNVVMLSVVAPKAELYFREKRMSCSLKKEKKGTEKGSIHKKSFYDYLTFISKAVFTHAISCENATIARGVKLALETLGDVSKLFASVIYKCS